MAGIDPTTFEQSLISQRDALQAEASYIDPEAYREEMDKKEQALQADIGKVRQEKKDLKMPTMTMPDYKPLEVSTHAKMMAGILGVIAVAAGSAKGGARGAMTSLNSALQGMMTGYKAATDQHMQEYETHLKKMESDFKNEISVYQKTLDDKSLTEQQMVDQLRLEGKQHGNEYIAMSKTKEEALKRVNANNKMLADVEKARYKAYNFNTAAQKERSIRDYLEKNPGANRMDAEKAYRDSTKFGPKGKKGSSLFGHPRGGEYGEEFNKKVAAAMDMETNKGFTKDQVIQALIDAGVDPKK